VNLNYFLLRNMNPFLNENRCKFWWFQLLHWYLYLNHGPMTNFKNWGFHSYLLYYAHMDHNRE
jgi:hypothetical protein